MKKKFLSLVLIMMFTVLLITSGSKTIKAEAAGAKNPTVTYTTVTEGFDWGPAVTKVILNMGTKIDSKTLTKDTFTVSSEKIYMGTDQKTNKQVKKDDIAERKVLKAYVSDAKGKSKANGTYITISMEVGPTISAASPFGASNALGLNTFADIGYIVKLKNNAGLKSADGKTITMAATNKKGMKGNTNLIADDFDKTGKYTQGDITLTYASYTPKKASKKKGSNPLIIWLHGGGEGGTDPTIALLGNKVVNLATDKIQSYFGDTGAYVLVPQSPTMWLDSDGKGTMLDYSGTGTGKVNDKSYYTSSLMGLIKNYVKNHPEIDTNRIYLGGCSNGGYMTMNLIINYPGYFAAAFPICEVYSVNWLTDEKIAKIVDTPIWFTHSQSDPIVQICKGTLDFATYAFTMDLDKDGKPIPLDEFSNAAYNRLVAAGAKNVHYSLWPKVEDLSGKYFIPGTKKPYEYFGHFSWIYTLNNQCKEKINGKNVTIFEWMADQSKK